MDNEHIADFVLQRILEKTFQLIFCSILVKYEPISIKIGRHVLEETFNKNTHQFT